MSSDNQFVIVEDHLKKKSIHPFAQLLNREDLDDCDWLEHVAFDPVEAASREKVSVFDLVKFDVLELFDMHIRTASEPCWAWSHLLSRVQILQMTPKTASRNSVLQERW